MSILFVVVDCAMTAMFFAVLKKFVIKFPILCIILHVFPIIMSQFLFSFTFQFWMIFVLAFADAISSALYYGSLNLLFGFIDKDRDTAKFETGSQIGSLCFSVLSAVLLGEIANSLIFLLVASSVMYVISIIILLVKYKQLMSLIKDLPTHKFLDVLKGNKWFNFYNMCFGITDAITENIMPVYIYYAGLSFTGAGLLVAVKVVLKILANYIAKLFTKKDKLKLAVIIFSIVNAISIASIIFVKNVYAIFAISLLISFSNQLTFVILFEQFVINQTHKGIYQDSVFCRDIVLNSSRSIFSAIYLILPVFPVVFALGSAFTASISFFGCKAIDQTKKEA